MAAAKLLASLDEQNIQYEVQDHEKAMTMDDMRRVLPEDFQKKGAVLKNLFLYDKKKNYFILSAKADSTTNLKQIATSLGAPSLRMADATVLEAQLNVPGGSVTPLAVCNDQTNAVTVVLDDKLKNEESVLVHPLHNEATISIKTTDLVDFIEKAGNKIRWIDLSIEAPPPAANAGGAKPVGAPKPAAVPKSADAGEDTSGLGITVKKSENFAEWYTQVITKGEMIQYYDVSGCYVIRPWAFHVWECVQKFIDTECKKLGVENAYFPMFVLKKRLEAEADHVEGFSPEVAWVTKYGDTDLSEPIAIRPTSETIMYPSYAKWIRSHRDLPVLLNQWNTVVRWEFKQPTPFIRTREFLWQEGHTAHESKEEAVKFVYDILDIYARTYSELLAVPVVKGIKSPGEKFAGADMTTTVETYIEENGRGVQAATSHFLGENFAKIFGIKFEDKERKTRNVNQTSWGFTTRSVGTMILIHGDDKGLVMPPRVAQKQVVIVPIVYKSTQHMVDKAHELRKILEAAGIRTKVDDRDNYTAGWKFHHWEAKGVPIRLELGPKDMENEQCRVFRRDNFEKCDIKWVDLATKLPEMLEQIHKDMFAKAQKKLENGIVKIREWDEVLPALNQRKLVMAPWCCEKDSEEVIKEKTQGAKEATQPEVSAADVSTQEGGAPALSGAMKALCIPLEQPELPVDAKCFVTGKPATKWCLFGRSY